MLKFLRMDLQHFAEPGDTETQTDQIDDTTSAETQKTVTETDVDKQVEQKIPYDRFKAKVDEANELKRKLEEFETKQQEAERKKLEEEGKYKDIADQLQAELQRMKGDALQATKRDLLRDAGYQGDQAALLSELVKGETEDEMKTSLDSLKATIPPKKGYVDPSIGNGTKVVPKQKNDAYETARERARKLLKRK